MNTSLTISSWDIMIFLIVNFAPIVLIIYSIDWYKNSSKKWKIMPLGYIFIGIMIIVLNVVSLLTKIKLDQFIRSFQ